MGSRDREKEKVGEASAYGVQGDPFHLEGEAVSDMKKRKRRRKAPSPRRTRLT